MTIQIDETKLAKLNTMTRGHGSHKTFEEGRLRRWRLWRFWPAKSFLGCPAVRVCPVIARAMIRLNDRISDAKLRTELLFPLLPRLIGSRASREVMIKRGFVAAAYGLSGSSCPWRSTLAVSRQRRRGGATPKRSRTGQAP